MKTSLGKRHIYVIIGLLILFLGIFIVNAVVDKTKAWHSADNILVTVDSYTMTLQETIDNNVFIDGATQSYTTEIPDPGHGADKIWVSVDGSEMTLQDAISTIGLCGSSSHSYTGSINPGHFASEIEVTGGNSFQELIDSGEFCCVLEYGQSCGDTLCMDAGTIACDGTCIGTSYKPVGTSCGTKDCDTLDTTCRNYHDITKTCDGAGNCVGECNSYANTAKGTTPCDGSNDKACDGAGSCLGWSGKGCSSCPFGSHYTSSVSKRCYLNGNQGSHYYYGWTSWSYVTEPVCYKKYCCGWQLFCPPSKPKCGESWYWKIKP